MTSDTYLINLDRRPDRLAQFTAAAAAAGVNFRRFGAFDGSRVTPPPEWKQNQGALGCRLSHLGVLREALARGLSEVTVYEDDAIFVEDFAARHAAFRAAVDAYDPAWEGLFLGGQHTRPPTHVADGLHRCTNTQRTHAYTLRGSYIREVYDVFAATNTHIDHAWGHHQAKLLSRVYAPENWLVGQSGGLSDLTGRQHVERFWRPATVQRERPPRPPRPERPTLAGASVVSHGGDVGDLLAALASFDALFPKGVDLVLHGSARVREPFTPAKVDALREFLLLQPYVRSVRFSETVEGVDLDQWRRRFAVRGQNLADMFAEFAGLEKPDREKPWLVVDRPHRVAPVVVHRSPRYHGHDFPWAKIVREYAGRLVMVGSPDEHADFVRQFGEVPYHPTPTYLDLARVIAGASLFIGNQSSPYWCALGLGVRTWLEQHRSRPGNSHWARAGALFDGVGELPVVG